MFERRVARGFTLVELLVVMSIIALLIALLLPALAHARDVATRTLCATRIRQVTMVATQYENDWNYILPSLMGYDYSAYDLRSSGLRLLFNQGYLERSMIAGMSGWGEEKDVAPFRGKSILLCPSGKRFNHLLNANKNMSAAHPMWDMQDGALSWTGDPYGTAWWTGTGAPQLFFSYSINAHLNKQTAKPDPTKTAGKYFVPRKSNAFGAPSSLVYLMENHHENAVAITYMKQQVNPDPALTGTTAPRYYRFSHGDAVNYSCYDGSVRQLNKDAFIPFNTQSQAVAAQALPFKFE